MTITTNAAEVRDQVAPLYRRFDGQTDCQDAHIEIDPAARTLRAAYNPEVGNAVPMSVWHNHQYRLTVSAYLTGSALADLMEDGKLLALAATMCDGHSIEWYGANRVGRLTLDGDNALDDLARRVELLDERYTSDPDSIVSVYAVDEWVQVASDVGITAETDDGGLINLTLDLLAQAAQDHVLLEGELLDHLTYLRDELRA